MALRQRLARRLTDVEHIAHLARDVAADELELRLS